jgi:short-chain fatty acids transporter
VSLGQIAVAFTAWTERWIPDAFIFALIATAIVIAAALLTGATDAAGVLDLWGGGFWELLPFTMQMSLVIITGYVVATAPAVHRAIRALAALPKTPRASVATIALFAMLSAWFNWGFSLIFSAMLAKEVARRQPRVDYRLAAAAAFLGLGSVWAQGLSGSAALQMATPNALQPAIRAIVEAGGRVPGGIIPLRNTIFLWQSAVSVVVEIAVVTLLVMMACPDDARARSAADLGVDLGAPPDLSPGDALRVRTPGEWLEHSPLLPAGLVILSAAYLVRYFWKSGDVLNALNLNTVNLAFLTLGVALHGTPSRLMRAVREATPGVWGVILQFPFYAGIAAIISKTHLNEAIAGWFVQISTPLTFPGLIAAYSALLGVFVPSGGSKWVIEAPYVMQAAHDLKVHLGWMVAVYDLGEALANLVQPFWMVPILGLFGLRARDVMGYTFLIFVVLAPLVLVLVTLLGTTLPYPL